MRDGHIRPPVPGRHADLLRNFVDAVDGAALVAAGDDQRAIHAGQGLARRWRSRRPPTCRGRPLTSSLPRAIEVIDQRAAADGAGQDDGGAASGRCGRQRRLHAGHAFDVGLQVARALHAGPVRGRDVDGAAVPRRTSTASRAPPLPSSEGLRPARRRPRWPAAAVSTATDSRVAPMCALSCIGRCRGRADSPAGISVPYVPRHGAPASASCQCPELPSASTMQVPPTRCPNARADATGARLRVHDNGKCMKTATSRLPLLPFCAFPPAAVFAAEAAPQGAPAPAGGAARPARRERRGAILRPVHRFNRTRSHVLRTTPPGAASAAFLLDARPAKRTRRGVRDVCCAGIGAVGQRPAPRAGAAGEAGVPEEPAEAARMRPGAAPEF